MANEAWIARQTAMPEARRRYEEERLILWTTEAIREAMDELGLTRADLAEGGPDHRVAEIRAGFLVVYRTNPPATFPPDALHHFAKLNGTYNAWPYWRELVQSMTMRAGMSGITVPVFRPKVREVEVQEALPIPDEEANGAVSPTEQSP